MSFAYDKYMNNKEHIHQSAVTVRKENYICEEPSAGS
jgi:hypothetical protein